MERERERYIATWMLSLLASGKGFNGFVFHEANNSAPLQSLLVHFSLAFFFHSASLTLSLSLSLFVSSMQLNFYWQRRRKKERLGSWGEEDKGRECLMSEWQRKTETFCLLLWELRRSQTLCLFVFSFVFGIAMREEICFFNKVPMTHSLLFSS